MFGLGLGLGLDYGLGFKVRLHDATKLMRRATKSRSVNGLICATCDCCMLSQES